MKVRPIGDHLLIRRLAPSGAASTLLDPTTYFTSPIVVPDAWLARPLRGVVLAVGRGAVGRRGGLTPVPVKRGQVVWFQPKAGSELKLAGLDVVVLKADELLGVES